MPRHWDACGSPLPRLEAETSRFLDWLKGASNDPPLLKAGLGHLWLVTLHPLDDGNGRIARAIGDLLLAHLPVLPLRSRLRAAALCSRQIVPDDLVKPDASPTAVSTNKKGRPKAAL